MTWTGFTQTKHTVSTTHLGLPLIIVATTLMLGSFNVLVRRLRMQDWPVNTSVEQKHLSLSWLVRTLDLVARKILE